MQVTNGIRDKTKPTQTTSTPVSIKPVAISYQQPITNTSANTSFLRLLSSIPGAITPTLQYSDKEKARLMKKGRCSSCK